MQKEYDSGASFRAIGANFGLLHQDIIEARTAGLFKSRTPGQATSLRLKGKAMPESIKEKVRKGMALAVIEGRQRTPKPGGITAKTPYVKIDGSVVLLHGSWEVRLAQRLDALGVDWERPQCAYQYIFEGALHRYAPDFYIPSRQLFVEVKGYEVDKDRAKWSQFSGRLAVVRQAQMTRVDSLTLDELCSLIH